MAKHHSVETNRNKESKEDYSVKWREHKSNRKPSDIHKERVDSHFRNNDWRSNIVLKRAERQFILGTLLGDTSIGLPNKRSKSPRLSSNHSLKQHDWSVYKANMLHRINPRLEILDNPGYGCQLVRMVTSCLPCLNSINSLCRPKGKKIISSEWLNSIGPRGLAWWYCDDGTLSQRRPGSVSARFHTEGFGESGTKIIQKWFNKNYGKTYIYIHKKRYFFVSLSAEATKKLFSRIKPHIPECMLYKIGKRRKGL